MVQRRQTVLLAPGPTEVDPVVLEAMSKPAESHFAYPFAETFGNTLTMVRHLFQSKDPNAQPFVISGSGSLGWDFVATNFIEPGENVLCLSTGFFSDAFADCLSAYGVAVNKMTVPIGGAHDLADVERELRARHHKALVATHVETSTGVLTPLKPLADLLKRVSPETLLVVDGVASIGAEEFYFDDWNIDIVLTGSQKAVSAPPGLSILMVSPRAMEIGLSQTKSVRTWYASLPRWLPIMQSYEKKEIKYFATPPTQLVHALHTSLTNILSSPLEQRFQEHREKSAQVKAAITELGLTQLATDPTYQANGLTAFWLPEGLTAKELLATMTEKGFVLSGGMHKEHGQRYVRFGHMGYSVISEPVRHIGAGIQALRESIIEYYLSQQMSSGFPANANVEYEYSASSEDWQMNGQQVLDFGIEVI